jgi:hypothetical protein
MRTNTVISTTTTTTTTTTNSPTVFYTHRGFNHLGMVKEDPVEKNSNSINETDKKESIFLDYSLEILSVIVSIFFVVTVFVWGDRFVVSIPTDGSEQTQLQQRQQRIIIDADALLKEEFEKLPSSVEF